MSRNDKVNEAFIDLLNSGLRINYFDYETEEATLYNGETIPFNASMTCYLSRSHVDNDLNEKVICLQEALNKRNDIKNDIKSEYNKLLKRCEKLERENETLRDKLDKKQDKRAWLPPSVGRI